MEYEVKVSEAAEMQLKQISDYISVEVQAPQAAENVLDDLQQAILSLGAMPERIPLARNKFLKKHALHCMIVRQYLIYFQIDKTAAQVNVVAVIYGKRDQKAQMKNLV